MMAHIFTNLFILLPPSVKQAAKPIDDTSYDERNKPSVKQYGKSQAQGSGAQQDQSCAGGHESVQGMGKHVEHTVGKHNNTAQEHCKGDGSKCHQDSCQNAQDSRGQTQQTAANTKEHGKGHNDEHSP